MKKLLFLLPALIGGAMLTGCVEQAVVTTGPGPVYYGDPYYTYGDVQYYYVGGRYFYYRNNQRFYVTGLPSGGSYWHGHGNYHGNNNVVVNKQNKVYVNKYDNVNVHKQNKVVNQQNVVQKQGQQNGKKWKKGDKKDNNQQHP